MKTVRIDSIRIAGTVFECRLPCGCTVERKLTKRLDILAKCGMVPGEWGKPWALTPGSVRHECKSQG